MGDLSSEVFFFQETAKTPCSPSNNKHGWLKGVTLEAFYRCINQIQILAGYNERLFEASQNSKMIVHYEIIFNFIVIAQSTSVSLLGLGEWFSVYLACCDYCVLCLFECL